MSQRMKLRISGGPSTISLKIEDLETGKILPVTAMNFYADVGGHVAAEVTLLIHEVDLNLDIQAEIREQTERVTSEVADAIRDIPGVLVRGQRDVNLSTGVVS